MVSLWHLSMGRISGPTAAESANWSLMQLSPDGQALVGWSTLDGKYRSTVWDSKTGKRIWRGTRDFRVQPWRDFVGTDSIFEVHSDLRVWNYRSGKLTHEIELPRGAGRGGVVSPSGRYIVLASFDQKLRFIDLRSSKLAGELAIPDLPDVDKIRVQGMSFSDDGAELAVLLRTSRGTSRTGDAAAIVSWSMRTGELQQTHMISRDSIAKLTVSGNEPAIACLPKSDGWLVWNAGVVDRETGALLGLLPAPPRMRRFASPTWPLADGRILGHLGVGRGADSMFGVYELGGLVRARSALARAGKPVDLAADLPKTHFAGTDWGAAHARLSALKAIRPEDKQALAEDVLLTILNDLRSEDPARAESALEALASAQPQVAQQARVLPALREISSKRQTGFIAITGFWTLGLWQAGPIVAPTSTAAKGQLGALTADLESKDFARVVAAFRSLGALDSEAAAGVVGAHYAVNRALAKQTLSKMRHQRTALLAMLTHEEWTVRVDAVRMLGAHGTPDDISPLEALRADPNRIVQMQVPKAIEQILSGEKK